MVRVTIHRGRHATKVKYKAKHKNQKGSDAKNHMEKIRDLNDIRKPLLPFLFH